jgi:hypothetical protein
VNTPLTGRSLRHRSTKYTVPTGFCKGCGLSLFGDEKTPGQCGQCLPTSAVAYLGRRGDSCAANLLPRPMD